MADKLLRPWISLSGLATSLSGAR